MNRDEAKLLLDKITAGIELAVKRVIDKAKSDNDEIVVSRNGKVTWIKARDVK